MQRFPLRRVHLQHPWLVGTILSTPVYIRARDKEDAAGFTKTEANAIFDLLLLPNFDQFMADGISRCANTFSSTDLGERDIVVCLVGTQLQVFPEHPAVDIVTAKWRSDGRHNHTAAS